MMAEVSSASSRSEKAACTSMYASSDTPCWLIKVSASAQAKAARSRASKPFAPRQAGGLVAMNTPLITALQDVLERGRKAKQFRAGIDPLDVYLSLAGMGFFYLSNRWTLSTVFRSNLMDKAEPRRWGEHIVDVTLRFVSV